MKKILVIVVLTLLITTLVILPASAQQGKVNIKGEVLTNDGGVLTVLSNKGVTYTVTAPAGVDTSSIEVGASVLIKGSVASDGSIEATTIKQLGSGNDDDADDDDKDNNGKKPDNGNNGKKPDNDNKPEGGKDNSAFCAEDKQDKFHPFSPVMAERYGVTEEWVNEYFCQGYSIGAIMLALKTSQMDGMDVDPATLLEGRAEGNAWGQMWKTFGLIGNEKNGHSPPGLLKKPAHAGPKDK